MRTDLNCPYQDKDLAKSLGAKWDMARKTWYIVDMEDLTPFMQWIPGHRANPPKTTPKTPADHITLKEYMSIRYTDNVKALTFEAARAFRVPYPLEHGWFEKYATNSIPFHVLSEINTRSKKGKKCHTKPAPHMQKPRCDGKVWATTGSVPAASCGCHVLPWDDCEHTEAAAQHAMAEMLS